MAEQTNIEWAHDTMNPWWGCQRVSPGCVNCYAESLDGRWHPDDRHWGPTALRKPQSEAYWRKPIAWNKKAAATGQRRRVFCASMADVFELLPADHPSARMQSEARIRLWNLIEATPHLDWLLLTKRPENLASLLPWMPGDNLDLERLGQLNEHGWPYSIPAGEFPNVWLGVTAEDQQRADERIPILLETSAAVRFVSYEPALEPLSIFLYLHRWGRNPGIDWLIAGAESGSGARPCDDDWLRSARDQCRAAGVPFFLKQKVVGGIKVSLPQLDGHRHAEVPVV